MTCFSVDKYIKYRRQTKPAFAGKLLLKTSFETALHCTGSNIRAFSQNAISSKKASPALQEMPLNCIVWTKDAK